LKATLPSPSFARVFVLGYNKNELLASKGFIPLDITIKKSKGNSTGNKIKIFRVKT
jgi:hypothetical protein